LQDLLPFQATRDLLLDLLLAQRRGVHPERRPRVRLRLQQAGDGQRRVVVEREALALDDDVVAEELLVLLGRHVVGDRRQQAVGVESGVHGLDQLRVGDAFGALDGADHRAGDATGRAYVVSREAVRLAEQP
jgi:hypothetical protein